MKTRLILMISATLLLGGLPFGQAVAANDTAVAAADDAMNAGRRALDQRDWAKAREIFTEIARSKAGKADEALYWKAYAETRSRDGTAARKTIQELKSLYPNSNWIDDARALLIELRGPTDPDQLPEDEELKLYALQALMLSDPDKALPIVKRMINEGKSEKLKERALFLLLQSDSKEARDMLGGIAFDTTAPFMQRAAIQTLGMIGDEESLAILDRAYRETKDDSVRMQIIQSFMTSGEAARIERVLATEKDTDLRQIAIQMLGIMGETKSLREHYAKETDVELRAQMMQAFAMAGDGETIARILKTEKDPEIRSAAIGSLIMVDNDEITAMLPDLYRESKNADERVHIAQMMAMKGDSTKLIELFKTEKDPQVRRHILQMMAMFGDDEAADFLLELLEEK